MARNAKDDDYSTDAEDYCRSYGNLDSKGQDLDKYVAELTAGRVMNVGTMQYVNIDNERYESNILLLLQVAGISESMWESFHTRHLPFLFVAWRAMRVQGWRNASKISLGCVRGIAAVDAKTGFALSTGCRYSMYVVELLAVYSWTRCPVRCFEEGIRERKLAPLRSAGAVKAAVVAT